ncbi:hypothetical protein CEXT_712091 [Caerostris extrusa]|uniref:Secreted protein n=1 Tax=Caerostris extrusa TaxID=172846 RepID=A0AAV4QMU7_CAEEX|nr:hypothetical protein CEXT_712091 [Caerostris extrusa]
MVAVKHPVCISAQSIWALSEVSAAQTSPAFTTITTGACPKSFERTDPHKPSVKKAIVAASSPVQGAFLIRGTASEIRLERCHRNHSPLISDRRRFYREALKLGEHSNEGFN